MPRSRSRSIASRTCASISRICSAPVISRNRSASVDLPWSMCAMTEKFLMRCASTTGWLLSGFERMVTLRILGPDVLGARTNEAVVRVLLEHVGGPARHPAGGKDRGEELDGDVERVVGRRRVEVDVRVQLLLRHHQRLDPLRHLEPD